MRYACLEPIHRLTLTFWSRSWKFIGSAIHGAFSLGLHLRNVGACTSDTSKEIRYRVWWSLYTVEHLLSVLTGRPSCIVESTCTTPLPVPFDESDFQKEEVARLISSSSRGGPSQLARIAVSSGTSSLKASLDCDNNDSSIPANPKDSENSGAEFLKGLPPCISLYFLQLTTLTSIAKRMTNKLYSPEAVHAPWASTEFAIQSLMLEIDSWFMNLPGPYDFTSTQTSQCPLGQKMSLAFQFYSTKIGITRPCLCRLDSIRLQDDKAYEFCSKAAAECVESACHMLTLFPETPDTSLLYKMCPWWCILHFLMQATTVLLLELAFRSQHVPEKASTVSKAARKALEWLSVMSKTNLAAERAWKLCDGFLRRLAPHISVDVSEFPYCADSTAATSPDGNFDATTAAASAVAADNLAAELDSFTCSPMDQSSNTPLANLVPYGLEPPELLGFMKPDKQLPLRNSYDDCMPYDSSTGQLPDAFFPSGANIDLDLGYLWDNSIC